MQSFWVGVPCQTHMRQGVRFLRVGSFGHKQHRHVPKFLFTFLTANWELVG
jgi:hypothetical protein